MILFWKYQRAGLTLVRVQERAHALVCVCLCVSVFEGDLQGSGERSNSSSLQFLWTEAVLEFTGGSGVPDHLCHIAGLCSGIITCTTEKNRRFFRLVRIYFGVKDLKDRGVPKAEGGTLENQLLDLCGRMHTLLLSQCKQTLLLEWSNYGLEIVCWTSARLGS